MKELVHIIQAPPFWLKSPALGPFYLKKYLEKKGVSAEIIDLNNTIFQLLPYSKNQWLTLNEEFEKTLFFIAEEKLPVIFNDFFERIKDTEFIAFSIFKRNMHFSFLLAEKIKEKFPSKKIIFGGPQTLLLDKENNLNPQYKWVIGEGEIPLHKIVQNKTDSIYRFQEIEDLDQIPFIDFEGVNLSNYSWCIPLISSRGCLYKCNFCSEKNLYRKFRCHCPQYMRDQIKYLIKKHKITRFIFTDSMINHSNEWLTEFCNLLITGGLKIQWEAQMRIKKKVPLSLAKLLEASGCYNLFIGLESGSNKTLQNMNKGFTADDALDFFKTLYAANLHFEVSLILGYPQESEEDFRQTLAFIVKNKKVIPKIAQINPFIDYLGNYGDNNLGGKQATKRLFTMINTLNSEKIRYTKGFINNLIYQK
ncbi:MAG: B12-binding domain-containing radical SAM protein [Candidatus Omnitrophota bacterium]|nr:MAG: B12-binding domain-containing radical SAM protein [Candidatus Omnitrophota bacterium]